MKQTHLVIYLYFQSTCTLLWTSVIFYIYLSQALVEVWANLTKKAGTSKEVVLVTLPLNSSLSVINRLTCRIFQVP